MHQELICIFEDDTLQVWHPPTRISARLPYTNSWINEYADKCCFLFIILLWSSWAVMMIQLQIYVSNTHMPQESLLNVNTLWHIRCQFLTSTVSMLILHMLSSRWSFVKQPKCSYAQWLRSFNIKVHIRLDRKYHVYWRAKGVMLFNLAKGFYKNNGKVVFWKNTLWCRRRKWRRAHPIPGSLQCTGNQER